MSIEKKELERIEPFNDLYYRSCFYNALFPIVMHFNGDIIPFILNDLRAYSYTSTGQGINLDIEFIQLESTEKILSGMNISMDTKEYSSNIIGDIRDSILKDRPALIFIDCFYESIRKDAYRSRHIPHNITIFGFDDINRQCHIIEHKYRESLTYEKMTISFEDIIDSYESYLANYQQYLDMPTFFEFYPGEEGRRNTGGTIVLSSFQENLVGRREIIEKSLENLKLFIDEYKQMALSEILMKQVSERVLMCFTNIMNIKRVEKYATEKLFKEDRQVYELVDNILIAWNHARLILAKYVYSLRYTPDTFNHIIESLHEVYRNEHRYYEVLLGRADSNC